MQNGHRSRHATHKENDMSKTLNEYDALMWEDVKAGDSAVEVEVEEELYGVNLLETTLANYKALNGGYTWNNNVATAPAGATFTVNDDGSININTDGAVTSGVGFYITPYPWNKFTGGSYILSSGGAALTSTFKLTVEAPAGTNNNLENSGEKSIDCGNSISIANARIWIAQGTTVSNVTIKPQLIKAKLGSNLPYHQYNEQAIQNQLNAQGVLGAKNVFDYKASNTPYSVDVTQITDGINVKSTSDGTWRNTAYVCNNLLKNTDYIFNVDIGFVSGSAGIFINGSTDGSAWTGIISKGPFSANTHVKIPFTTGNYTSIQIKLHVTLGTSSGGEANYTKMMISLATDPDDTYVPYAMTNKELTDKTQYLNNNVITTEQGLSFEPFIKSAITQMIAKGALVNQGDMTKTVVVRAGVGRYIFSMGKTHEDHIVGMAIGEALNNSEFVYSYTISTDTVIAKQISIASA